MSVYMCGRERHRETYGVSECMYVRERDEVDVYISLLREVLDIYSNWLSTVLLFCHMDSRIRYFSLGLPQFYYVF